jgi:hypothetical protein
VTDTRDPAKLRQEAERLEAEAATLEWQLLEKRALAELRRQQAAAIERLRERHQPDTVPAMTDAARTHISRGRTGRGASSGLVAAANAKGHTLRSLASAIETETGRRCPQSIITRALQGARPIRRSAARLIETLTGYKATAAHWPGGWSDED